MSVVGVERSTWVSYSLYAVSHVAGLWHGGWMKEVCCGQHERSVHGDVRP